MNLLIQTNMRCAVVAIAISAVGTSTSCLWSASAEAEAAQYYALPSPTETATAWGLLNRDGANRETEPYLSSLVSGENAAGKIQSPPFVVTVDQIQFTIRGHDGRGGGRNENYVALIDDASGDELRRTVAPGDDGLQPRSWDVKDLRGRRVRFVAVDGIRESAYAWLGVGMIDAGESMRIDFRKGIPRGWTTKADDEDLQRHLREVRDGPVPFRGATDSYSHVPANGTHVVALGFPVQRVFLLGCTAPSQRVLQKHGSLTIVYADGSQDAFPFVYGFNIESPYKMPSGGETSFLRPVGDGTEYLCAIRPRSRVIARIEFRREANAPRPRISAVTCEVADEVHSVGEAFARLEPVEMKDSDARWLDAHTLSSDGPNWQELADSIRRARGVPITLEDIQQNEEPGTVAFRRLKISDAPFEAAGVCDVDEDGHTDIVSGDFWYRGPGFRQAVRFRKLLAQSGYHDSFHEFTIDVNGDGRTDVVSGGWFGKRLVWYENPNDPLAGSEWAEHEIDRPGSIETSRLWDVTGDGHLEIVPNSGGNVVFYRLLRDRQGRPVGRFEKHVVKQGGCGHGLGFGDVNGDGRSDFVVPDGWIEAPEDPLEGQWRFHEEFHLGGVSVPILVHDVNGDGRADLIYGMAHDYGLYWLEQQMLENGVRRWESHVIEDQGSQYHDVQLHDLNGDGQMEIVTGKRYHAHNGHDPGAEDPVFVRYFDWDRGGFYRCHTIDYGKAGQASGVGIHFCVVDVTGDGRLDIVAPGKEGLFVFVQE